MTSRYAFVFTILAVVSTAYTAAADVTYFDGTFNNSDWQVPIMYQGYNGGTLNAYQVASGGNPGSYREVDTTLNDVGGLPGRTSSPSISRSTRRTTQRSRSDRRD